MYPPFLAEAEAEGDNRAATSFRYALAVEEIHHGLYSDALSAVRGGKDLPAETIYVCPVCGNTVIGSRPDQCSVCGVDGSKFREVE